MLSNTKGLGPACDPWPLREQWGALHRSLHTQYNLRHWGFNPSSNYHLASTDGLKTKNFDLVNISCGDLVSTPR